MKECKFYLQGRCMRGESCSFYHGSTSHQTTSTSMPKSSTVLNHAHSTMTPQAPSFIPKKPWHATGREGEIIVASKIPSKLPRNSEPVPTAGARWQDDSRRTVPCIYYLRGSCRNGDNCPYSHPKKVEEESDIREANNLDEKEDDPNEHDDFTREISGAFVKFEDGATVSKITLPTDFSTVRVNGLSLDSTLKSTCTLLREFGFEITPESVRIFKPAEATTASADVKVEDPLFAKNLCAIFNLDNNNHSNLQVLTVSPSTSLSGPTSRRVSCRKIRVSWHKPTRLVWLNFGNQEIARRVSEKFNKGTYKVLDQVVSTNPPKYSHTGGRWNLNHVAWTVVLKEVPIDVTKTAIEESIRADFERPRHIELSKLDGAQARNLENSSVFVESLFTNLGSANFVLNPNSQGKRFKALVRFDDEVDAREALRTLHDKPQDCLNGGKLTVQLISSAKFKVPTSIYDALQTQLSAKGIQWREIHLQFKVYRNMDALQRFTTLKIEGEEAKDVANATNALEGILAGEMVKDDGEPVWSTALSGNGETHKKLKELQQKHSVVVIRNKTKRRLQFFGPPDRYQQVQREIIELVKAESTKPHFIPLDPDALSWVCQGGFKQITSALEDNVASLDIASNPKRIIITGSEKQYQTALAVLQGKEVDKPQVSATAGEDCTVCWTEAENPILTQCKHVYCLECFENLCTSASSTDGTFLTSCQGEMGKCAQVFSLRELQDHLSSTAFEDILEASHTSYIRRHPQSLRYCPTPDCGYIYRTTSTANTHTCPKCFELTCTACHAQHSSNMTCADYKDLNSGGYAAFEKYKREQGIKDCPKCSTPIEKTEGCNHMTCRGCNAHICWVCLRTFLKSGQCYDHMNATHGGIGLGYLANI